MVGLIASSAETLEALLSDVLDLARIEAGRLELKAEPFDLAQAARDVAALFEPSAAAKGLALSVETDAGRGRPLRRRRRAPAPGALQPGLQRGEVHRRGLGAHPGQRQAGRRCGGAAASRSTDTGIGFDAEAAERLFERFEQADGSITRRYGGTGLGLAISRSLVEAMGGRLVAVSRPGHGATFTLELSLPARRGAAPTPTPRRPRSRRATSTSGAAGCCWPRTIRPTAG